ncbi:GNAT family protein [Frigoribacterium sp. CFBP9030]|uniref:GNAT family N-acetyltransferase n=1 Tax=Frigoribacterium sp. CFBP9030 TaxID=3096537 RepID=UPI002A69FDBA|nr:GNAT family protein [Frigoribacterium sp. CFBP9030]MDY0893306.1 GNAT family protein [Frigoribacterium sp. CFBP9030]
MTARRPAPASLSGSLVTVSPLEPSDLPELHAAIGRPEVFAGGWGGGPAGYRADYDDWARFVEGYLLWESASVFGVRSASSGALVGTTTLGLFDLANESAHVGWTAYAPEVWGSGVNAETKLLVLGHAFEHGFGRIQLQADVLNDRSRAAILRLGATFEGVQRRMQRRADGSWRDTAVYSILVDEWPGVRAGLEQRLASSASAQTRGTRLLA